MRIRNGGREHRAGDPRCPGCTAVAGKHFPEPHNDIVTNCTGLLHAEAFGDLSTGVEVHYRCDKCDHFE
jgi:hypothetical protein